MEELNRSLDKIYSLYKKINLKVKQSTENMHPMLVWHYSKHNSQLKTALN